MNPEELESIIREQGLTPIAHSAQNRCFGCGPANPQGLRLEFYRGENGLVVTFASIPQAFEGMHGFLHGGIIATLLDETMSKAVRAQGYTAMTRQMEVDYLRPVSSQTWIRLEGRILRSEGRKHWTQAKLLNSAGAELAVGQGLFVEVRAREAQQPPTR